MLLDSMKKWGDFYFYIINNTLLIYHGNNIIKSVKSTDIEFLEEERLEFIESLNSII